MENKIVIYKSKKGSINLKISFNKNTVWLNQKQISLLFNIERSVITKHLKNIFLTKELNKKSNVQKMHIANSDKPVSFYNLDVIISLGYRINSIQATQFRIWATKILKQYLIKGYVLNQKRLKEQQKRLNQLSQSVALIKSKIKSSILSGQEAEFLEIIKNYIDSLVLLKSYDDNKINLPKLTTKNQRLIDITEVRDLINQLRKNNLINSEFFGNEYDNKLDGIIGAIRQSFDNKYLYKSIEEKAANILYLTIKDHPFIDGNKRIGSSLFIYFLSKNNFLFKDTGEIKINDRALVALALLIAVSNPKEKETIIKLIINLIKN